VFKLRNAAMPSRQREIDKLASVAASTDQEVSRSLRVGIA